MRKKKNKTSMEFSKKISITIITIFSVVIIYSMALMWKTDTADGLSYLIPSVTGLATACISFYFWKSKAENLIRMSKEHELTIDEINSIAETVNEINE